MGSTYRVEVGDVVLGVREHGAGSPLLLIAGIPAVADDWDPLAERMGETHRVIAFDNRGSGTSTVTPGPYTTRQLAGDAAGLLDALGVESAAVFGMSMGGMIAQELAIGWPEKVERLVLGCTHAGMRHATRPPRETGRAFAMLTDDWGERMRALAPAAFAGAVDPALLAGFLEKKTGDAQEPEGYRGQIAAVLEHDTADRLEQIRCPTLILTGGDDRIIPGESSRLLHVRIRGARLEVIPGTGHLFFLERPDASVRLLRDFLS
ncbi:MAG TPA: alpha/beta hydrolase [Solirubrobacteraceae bacterium]|jgi:pimeloyl-ACP methyl ester carboxylesterase|nr:alpha/beta hydrolase [Solirubrobacteraceae bacterium]